MEITKKIHLYGFTHFVELYKTNQTNKWNSTHHNICNITFPFFFYGWKQYLWKWSWFNKVLFLKGRRTWKMVGMKKEKECRWEKREVGMEGWYVAKFLSLWSCELPMLFLFILRLFASVIEVVAILQLFVLLKVSMTTCFKWTNYYFLLLSLSIMLHTILLWFSC